MIRFSDLPILTVDSLDPTKKSFGVLFSGRVLNRRPVSGRWYSGATREHVAALTEALAKAAPGDRQGDFAAGDERCAWSSSDALGCTVWQTHEDDPLVILEPGESGRAYAQKQADDRADYSPLRQVLGLASFGSPIVIERDPEDAFVELAGEPSGPAAELRDRLRGEYLKSVEGEG